MIYSECRESPCIRIKSSFQREETQRARSQVQKVGGGKMAGKLFARDPEKLKVNHGTLSVSNLTNFGKINTSW